MLRVARLLPLLLAVVLVAGVLSSAGARDAPPPRLGAELKGRGLVMGATPRRQLHFTFDDGPDPEQTERLLDAMDRFGVKGTFFFSMSRFDSREARNRDAVALAREVARRGHALGSHSYDHVRMARMRQPALREQLAQSDALFGKAFGARTYLFRPPFGSRNRALDRLLADGEYTTVLWNVGLADWVERPASEVEATFWKVLARNERDAGERGGIILMHDTHAWSVDAFVLINQALRARNCELLRAGGEVELFDVVDSLEPFLKPPGDAAYAQRQAELAERERARCASHGP